jgi:hypothetical protein
MEVGNPRHLRPESAREREREREAERVIEKKKSIFKSLAELLELYSTSFFF